MYFVEVSSQTSIVLKIFISYAFQKQPPRSVPRKRSSGNMQQIYRRTPMPNCDFNKVAEQSSCRATFWNRTSAWVFSCKFADIFRTPFLKNTSGRLLLVFHILLYTYICTKCTKLFIHVQEYAFFMNTIYFLYILFHRFKGSLRSSSPAVFV